MEQWKITVLECLEELSDAELQEREWSLGEDSKIPGPTELLCQCIDDSGIADAVEDGKGYPDASMPLLKEFVEAASKVDTNRKPLLVTKSSEWRVLQTLSAEVLALLRKEWRET